MNFYSKAKRDRQLRNMISTIYSKSRVSKNIFLQIKGILPKEVRAHFQKIEDAKTYLIQKRKIRNSRIKHKLTEVKNPKCLINKITPDSYSRCFGLHSSSFNRLKSVNSINLLPLLVKPYVKEVLVSRYLASPELNLSKLRILLDKQRTISPTLKFSSFSYMKTPELASFIFKRPLLK